MNARHPLAAALTLLSLVGTAPAQASSAPPPELFPTRPGLTDPFAGTMDILRQSRPVHPDFARLAAIPDESGARFNLDLFTSVPFRMHFNRRVDFGPGRYDHHGVFEGRPGSWFIISVYHDGLAATFFPADGRPWPVALQGAPGMHLIRELDTTGQRGGTVPMGPIRENPWPAEPSGIDLPGCNDDPDKIDVLVVFGKLAMSQAGGYNNTVAAVQNGIALSNQTNANSGLKLRFTLRSVGKVDYQTGWSLTTDLMHLAYKKGERTFDPQGYLDEVHKNRVALGADMVHLIVGDHAAHGNSAGVASVPRSQGDLVFDPRNPPAHCSGGACFSVSEWNQIGALAMTHELGHNFGCDHCDIPPPSWYSYGRGFRFGLWPAYGTTVMAYTYVPQIKYTYWSTPKVWHLSLWAVGDAGHDNARLITNTRQWVANQSRYLTYTANKPIITTQPKATTAPLGYNPKVFTVASLGASRWQWRFNGTPIPGATHDALDLPAVTAAAAGTYDCQVTNVCGTTTTVGVKLTVDPGRTVARYTGKLRGAMFGSALAAPGDVDGDGYGDLLVGAPGSAAKGKDTGAVRVVSGRTGADLLRAEYGIGERLGASVAAIGDVDDDGHPDLLAGAPGWNNGQGRVRVWSGRSRILLHTLDGDKGTQGFGATLAGLGDVDGDGTPDFVVGAPAATVNTAGDGYIRVFSGRTGKSLFHLTGLPNQRLGTVVAAAGDVDRDGRMDLAVTNVRSGSSPGFVDILSGGNWMLIHRIPDSAYGSGRVCAMLNLGDVDGDGRPDLALGLAEASAKGQGSGAVQVHGGKDGKALYTAAFVAGEALGSDLALAGDVNNDGILDLFAGAPAVGRVRTLSGKDGAGLALHTEYEGFGITLAGVDVDGDGRPDLAGGAPGSGDYGHVLVFRRAYSGAPGRLGVYGKPCLTGAGRLPRLTFAGWPALGTTLAVDLHAAPAATAALIALDTGRRGLDLGYLGAAGCTAYAYPILLVSRVTTATGTAGMALPIPSQSTLLGSEVHLQWYVLDPTANPAGLVTSDGGRARVGQ